MTWPGQYHTVYHRKGKSDLLRHDKTSEQPFPMYIGIKMYLLSGKNLLDWYHLIGISSSYDRIKQLTTDIASTRIAQKANGVALPSNTVKGVICAVALITLT